MHPIVFIIGLAIGAFVGWHVPEPSWAKRWWAKAKIKFGGISDKF